MHLPYVIDNRAQDLAGVLNDLLQGNTVRALDVTTAYFNVGGFDLVRDALEDLSSFRLLLGSQPGGADDLGLRRSLRRDLEEAPLDQETYRQVEALTRCLRRDEVLVRLYEEGFLHAKAYLCFADDAPGDRFIPVAGIVGSSNFTRAGLTTNQELNLTHKTVIGEGEAEDVEARAAVEPLLERPPRFSVDGLGHEVDSGEQSGGASEDQQSKPCMLGPWYDRKAGARQTAKPQVLGDRLRARSSCPFPGREPVQLPGPKSPYPARPGQYIQGEMS